MEPKDSHEVTFTSAIGAACNQIIRLIVRGLALSKIHPNVLTFLGLVINIGAAVLLAGGQFRWAGVVIIGAGLFDMVDGRVARETNRVTRFGGFFDSVLDRYSDLFLLTGLLVWYGSINQRFYEALTAVVMTQMRSSGAALGSRAEDVPKSGTHRRKVAPQPAAAGEQPETRPGF